MATMATTKKPTKAVIGRLAERQPELLNPLVAFFVFGWQKVFVAVPMHGVDQAGVTRILPNYVYRLGINACVSYLLAAPDVRDGDNDSLSTWCARAGWEKDDTG
jgi:hypothetical protein